MGQFPTDHFPPDHFPPDHFPGEGEEGTTPVAVGAYRHGAPAPITKRAPRDLYSLAKEFEAMED